MRQYGTLLSWVIATSLAAGCSSGSGGVRDIQIEKSEDAIPGQYIFYIDDILVSPTKVSALAEELVAKQGGSVIQVYDSGLLGFAAKGLDDTKALAIAADKRIFGIGQDSRITIQESQSGPPWNLDRIDSLASTLDGKYTYWADGTDIHVYVVDTGIRATHKEFGGRVTGGKSFINDGKGTDDCHGHGTHVAGVIGGSVYGVAKNVFLHPVRIADCSGAGAASSAIAAVTWIENELRAKTGYFTKPWPTVVNMSFTVPKNNRLDSLVNESSQRTKTLYVTAAGDNGKGDGFFSPAGPVTILTVSATDKADKRLSTANFGDFVQLFAPGLDIVAASHTDDTSTTTKSGTSMAAAHVSGVAAMLLQARPGLIGENLRISLLAGAAKNLVQDPRNLANNNNRLFSRISDIPIGFQGVQLRDSGIFDDINSAILVKDAYWQGVQFPDINGDKSVDICVPYGASYCLHSNRVKFSNPRFWSMEKIGAWEDDPTVWQTLRYVDLNGDGKTDWCVRGPAGVWCGRSNGFTFDPGSQWDTFFSDANAWNSSPKYWSTIQFADINGDKKADVCGRSGDGMVCALSNGTSFDTPAVWSGFFADVGGFGDADHLYGTIRLVDVNGDGKADLCGRNTNGFYCGLSNGKTFEPVTQWESYYSNAGLWHTSPAYWKTIQFADINGDKKMDLCGRAGNGIVCEISTGKSFGAPSVWEPLFADTYAWNTSPYYWATIRFPDVNGDGKADVCGRAGDGVRCALSNGTRFAFNSLWARRFDDTPNGFNSAQYYWGTINYPDINGDGKADVCGRSGAGFECGFAP